MRPTRVLAYVRVSSDAQERTGTSLAGQRDEIARYCAALAWPAPRFFVETESAGEENLARRVQLRALLDTAQRGDAVVVCKQDRWSRDTLFFLQSARSMQVRGVKFVSLAERFDLDTPEGRFAATVMAGVAEQERDRIRVRTVGRRQALRDQGCWTESRAPLGYRRDPATRRLVAHDAEAAIVREVFTMCIGGESIEGIARELRLRAVGRADGPPIRWDKKAVHHMLRARYYVGEIRRTDGGFIAAHEGIVPTEVFEQAQTVMQARRKGGRPTGAASRTRSWLLRSLAVCGSCGSKMGAAYSRSDAPHGYYACNGRMRGSDCDEPYARVDLLDHAAARECVRRLESVRDLLAAAKVEDTTETGDDARIGALEGALEAAKIRRQRAVSLAVDGIIDKVDLTARLAKIDDEIARGQARLAEEGRRTRLTDPTVRAEALADLERLRLAWQRLNVEGRRAIVERLVERIEIRGGAISMQWRSVESLCAATGVGNLFPAPVPMSAEAGGKRGVGR